jgi:hypothetical protein
MADPIEIPTIVGFESIEFEPIRRQSISPGGAGALQVSDRMTPMWSGDFKTPPLIGAPYNEMKAFLDDLEGALNPFLGYDPRRKMPYAYRHLSIANDPWTQTGQAAPRVTATSFANSTVTIDRLQNGAIITKGDYISWYDGVAWWLYRIGANATVSGNSVTIKVGPRPKSLVGGPYAIRYRKACCAMKIIGGYTAPESVSSPTIITFKGFQFINKAV